MESADCSEMFRLAYVSFLGAIVSTPVHFLSNTNHTQWAIVGLMVAAAAFLTAGMMRRP
jgi:hypothetical protein